MSSASPTTDSRLITAHEDLADALAGLHNASRPDALAGQVGHHADVLLGLLDRSTTPADRSRLEAVAVGSCAQAGMLTFNAGDRIRARRHFAGARNVADDSGDDTLCARALAVASTLCSTLPTGGLGGDTGRAVRLLRKACSHARKADDGTRAWLHYWLAPELAAAQDERGFRTALEAAERFSARSGQAEQRGFFARYLTTAEGRMIGMMGTGLVRLGCAEEAMDVLAASVSVSGPRWRVNRLADTAAAMTLQDAPQETCALLSDALTLALSIGHAMGIQRIRGVRAGFPASWAGLPCVVELDERLHVL